MSANNCAGTGNVVGAVMVVGGGIAGIQASLDLAEAGYKVYLVEQKSAIGGHMAQLDKTFPTNDCAMCIVSPKLVDCGRHRNIELLVDSDVMGVRGEAGNFTVRVRTRPRYIDLDKCTGCGDCANVCPVIIPSHFDEGLAVQRAVYKLYPQAVPNAYAIEKRGIAPCRDACPAHQRAQGYIALIREGRYEDALRVIKEDNPFPGICGRICNHRCEDACNRGKLDEPINIRALKRFVTDKVYAQPRVPPEPAERRYEERVAIIGGGPCGLTAAQDLCKLGYGVTVFEALPVAGGMLRVGVPEYRLPSWIVDREVQDIVDLGVELRLNTCVNNLDDVFAEGFDAVLIAVGAHEGIRLPIPGADLEGVLINTAFLRDVRLGNPPELGKRVAVIGAGDVAMDVARTAVRLGSEVHVYYRRTREEATADEEEMHRAEEEGVIFHWQVTPVEVVGDGNGRMVGIKCVRTEQGLPDETGRRRPVPIPGSEHFVPCDNVIFSVGQRAGLAFIPESAGVGITRQQTIAVNPNTLAATRPGVFAAGDVTTGTAFVIEAVAAGHKAAESIHRYLRGEELEPPPKPELPVVELTRAEIQERVQRGEVRVTPRVPVPELPVEERVRGFAEVETGYTDERAQAEAARCLACGICSECLSCVYTCQADAINHDMVERVQDVQVGAIILAPGYEVYQAEQAEEYGWGRFPNVVTALQFERLLSASGPTYGHVQRPSDGRVPRKIAFLQCVGSRDQTHDYCSAICCMYATKEAIMAVEHEPNTQVTIFMMDMRAFSKGYEEYYRRAQERYGIRYVRSRISFVREDPRTHNLILRYVSESASQRISDREEGDSPFATRNSPIVEEEFDLVVLSVGMEIAEGVRELGRRLGVELDEHGFCRTLPFQPLQTSRPGIFAVGPFREPKDIPESVVEASGAAAAAGAIVAPARWTCTREVAYPPERDVSAEEPRIGVFVCHCGSNIGGFLDVPAVAEYAASLPGVVHAEHNLYTCSQDSIQHITEKTRELGLNRVVVASCTPLTHEPLFQDSIRQAGLNPGMFQMANIRNQCSWVHSNDWEAATEKAKDLVRMAVAKALRLEPLHKTEVPVQKAVLVIGGGVAGMTAALTLADQGFPVHLVERAERLGGNLWNIGTLVDWETGGLVNWETGKLVNWGEVVQESVNQSTNPPVHQPTNLVWRDPQEFLRRLIKQVESHPQITVHLRSEFLESSGFVGNFTSRLRGPDGESEVRHGATIVATGGVEYRGPEYGYGTDPRIVTQQEFEARLTAGDDLPDSVVMILCVGPAERYCSRICCTTAIKNALALKRLNPDAQIAVLYRDIRTYGFKERLYREARRQGVVFVRYDFDRKPQVEVSGSRLGEPETSNPEPETQLKITVWESGLGAELVLHPDLLVLSMPVVPPEGADELATRLKVPVDLDGFFLEAHVKLRPVDFSSDGVFMAGMAHYPKFLDETIVQARAAAARAMTIVSRDVLEVGGVVAQVDAEKCVGCLTCVRICPYDVPQIRADFSGVGGIVGAAYIEPAQCHGCGICVAECPAKAIQLLHYRDVQVEAEIAALMNAASDIGMVVNRG
ncbi:MAG TPA: FAD-dependent oxidoreductase [Thermoflexia bacterium]|nr:FAD-dependent oxidoreductase [Thermoflexia bacterium]